MSVLFIILAAIFKAVSDTLKDHFDTSVFKWKDPRFWNPNVSYKYVGFLKFTRYRPDAWHLSNTAMIVSFCLAAVFHSHVFAWWIELLIAGILFNVSFNVFYNKILRR